METNDIWTQLFQDKPVPEDKLNRLQTEIMQSVLANPVNFVEEIGLAGRRKAGMILAVSLLLVGLGFGILIWFEGNILREFLTKFVIYVSGFLPLKEIESSWLFIGKKLAFVERFRLIVQYVWQQYSWQFIGCAILLLMMLGSFRTSNGKIGTSD